MKVENTKAYIGSGSMGCEKVVKRPDWLNIAARGQADTANDVVS